MKPTISCFLLCAALGANTLSGQTDPQRTDPRHADPRLVDHASLQLPPTWLDGALWCVGDDYKASFHDGFRFVPYLGESFAENQDFHWRTNAIVVGGRPASIAATPRVVPGAATCDLVWSHDVVERYHVRPEGVEQTFVFTALPAGDLEIHGRVTTPARAEARSAAHAPMTFRSADGRPVFTYGAATVVDADGVALAATTSWTEDGTLTLRVPGSWLAEATFPITVDPVIAPINVATGNTVQNTDICIAEAAGLTFFCYSRLASASDGDVYLRRATGSGLTSGNIVYVELGSTIDARRPCVAPCVGASSMAMAYQRRVGTGPVALAVHMRNLAATGLTSHRLDLTPPSGKHWSNPDLGGQATGTDGRMVLVYEEDDAANGSLRTDVFGRMVDTVLLSAVGSPFRLTQLSSAQSDSDRSRVRVNQANGGGSDGWIAVFQSLTRGWFSDDWDVVAARIRSNGTVAPDYWVAATGSTQHKLNPFVDGRNGEYRVVFATLPVAGNEGTPTSLGNEAYSARIEWPASGTPSAANDAPSFAVNVGQILLQGIAVDPTDDDFATVLYVNYGQGALRAAVLGGSGERVDDVPVRSGGNHYGAALTARAQPRRFPITTTTDDGTGSVFLAAYEHRVLPPVTTSGASCGGDLVEIGEHRLGNRDFAIELTGATPSGIGVLFFSTGPAYVPLTAIGMPGCNALVDLGSVLGTISVPLSATGNGTVTLSLTRNPGLGAFDLYAQGMFLAPGANPAGLLATKALVVPMR